MDAFGFSMNMDSLYWARIEARLLDEEEVDSDDSDDEECKRPKQHVVLQTFGGYLQMFDGSHPVPP